MLAIEPRRGRLVKACSADLVDILAINPEIDRLLQRLINQLADSMERDELTNAQWSRYSMF